MAALQGNHSKSSLLWSLPTEIVIEIMRYSPSFSCLWSLLNASSRFKSIFTAVAWEIVEDIMTRTTPICTQALMKIVLITRTSPDLFTGVSDVVSYMSRKKLLGILLREISPQVLHDFVELAHTIHAVAHACLEFYVKKSMTVKPQRFDDSDLEDWERKRNMLYSDRQSPGQPFQPKEFGPPTYLEEQIVIRVLWRLQVFLDMKTACRTGALAHWPEEERNHLDTVDFFEMPRLYHDSSCRWSLGCEKEQIHTVIDFIYEIAGDHQHGQIMENVLTHFLHRPPAIVYDQGYRLPCFPKPGPVLKKIRGLGKLTDVDREIEGRTVGCTFYFIMTRHPNTIIEHVSFKPYRKFGFAIWQAERMEELGFLGRRGWFYWVMEHDEPWFIWRSILTPEEDAERRGPAIRRNNYISPDRALSRS